MSARDVIILIRTGVHVAHESIKTISSHPPLSTRRVRDDNNEQSRYISKLQGACNLIRAVASIESARGLDNVSWPTPVVCMCVDVYSAFPLSFGEHEIRGANLKSGNIRTFICGI